MILRSRINRKYQIFVMGIYLCLWAACCAPCINGFVDGLMTPKYYFTLFSVFMVIFFETIWYLFSHYGMKHYISDDMWAIERIRLFCQAAVVVVFGLLMYTLYYTFVYDGFFEHAASGTFDNPAGLALYVCAVLPFAWLGLRSKKVLGFYSVAKYILVVLSVWVVWLSQSRTGLLCLVFYAASVLFRKSGKYKILNAVLSLILISGVAAGLLLYKQDSTYGRKFILERTWELISRQPWTGYGSGGFEKFYMEEQAAYFKTHPNDKYALLADEIRHPLNEFALVGINYGVVASLLMLVVWVAVMLFFYKRKDGFSQVLNLAMGALFIFSLFSYPFKYPVSWILVSLCLLYIGFHLVRSIAIQRTFVGCWLSGLLLIITICFSFRTIVAFYRELQWGKAARYAVRGQTQRAMQIYDRLQPYFRDNPYFLYNYAVEQFYGGFFEDALLAADECRCYWASYNLELLTGDIYKYMGRYKQAIIHYKQASHMCPVRFAPFEGLFCSYKQLGDTLRTDSIVKIVERKTVKVLSSDIIRIKTGMGLN